MAEKTKKNSGVLATIITIVSIAALLLSYGYLSKQINILVQVALFLVLLFFFNLFLFTKREMNNLHTVVWLFEIFYLVIMQLINFSHYEFLSGYFTPFWEIPLLIGTALGITVIVLIWKQSKFWGKLGYFILVVFITTALLASVITNLNYALDFSEPTKTVITIEDKDIDLRRKAPASYKFRFVKGSKKHYVEVPASVYNEYDVGDIYDLVVYNGAFGEEFYICADYIE